VRSYGLGFYVDLHVKADATISLEAAHEIAAKVKYAILEAVPNVVSVLVHMEPYRESRELPSSPLYALPPV
jgi:ferrous-iron efflux pump FieF